MIVGCDDDEKEGRGFGLCVRYSGIWEEFFLVSYLIDSNVFRMTTAF